MQNQRTVYQIVAGIVFCAKPIPAQECLQVSVSPGRTTLRQPVEVRARLQMQCSRCGEAYNLPQIEWYFPNTEQQLGGGTGPFTIHYIKPGKHPISAKITYINVRDPSDVCVVPLKNIAYVEVVVERPVELIGFSAEAVSQGVRLQWVVGYEHQVQEYILERKTSPTAYTTVKRVEAQGKTAYEPFKYEVIDWSASKSQTAEYRLSVVTTDKKIHMLSEATFRGAGEAPPRAAREVVIVLRGEQGEFFGKVYVSTRADNLYIVDPKGKIPPGKYTVVSASDNSLVGRSATVVQEF